MLAWSLHFLFFSFTKSACTIVVDVDSSKYQQSRPTIAFEAAAYDMGASGVLYTC